MATQQPEASAQQSITDLERQIYELTNQLNRLKQQSPGEEMEDGV